MRSMDKYVRLYRENGVTLIPLVPGGKYPPMRNHQHYWDNPPSGDEEEKWVRDILSSRYDPGALLGRASGGLAVLDFDSEEAFEAFKERLGQLDEVLYYALFNTDPGGGTWIVRTARGYHVYFRVEEYDTVLEETGSRHLSAGKVELFLKGATPLPPSQHPSGGQYMFLDEEQVLGGGRPIITLMRVQFKTILEAAGIRPAKPVKRDARPARRGGGGGLRLGERDISRLVERVSRYWVKGHRNELEFVLLGWLVKKGVPRDTSMEIVRRIVEATGDEEADKRYSRVNEVYDKIEEGGADPSGLRGAKGIIEIIEEVVRERNPGLGDGEARNIALVELSELEEILGARRDITVRAPYSTNAWFVNDPKRGILILRRRTDREGNVRWSSEVISDWYISKATLIRTGSQYSYRILFQHHRKTGEPPLRLSGQLDEITGELKRLHGIKRGNLIHDAVSSIISELSARGVAKTKVSSEATGVIPTRSGVKIVYTGVYSKLHIPREPDPAEARAALEALVKLRGHYDANKFDQVMLWAAAAPAGYALKKKYGVKQIYLLLHGEKQTGKTTLARLVTHGLYPVTERTGGYVPEEAQSDYRLSYILNLTTVPVLFDEVQGISNKKGLQGIIKRAATGDVSRWRGDTNKVYRARAALVFTSNYREIISDPALYERVLGIEFTHRDYVGGKDRGERAGFEEIRFNQYLPHAPHLGGFILRVIVGHWEEIARLAPQLQVKEDVLDLGRRIWVWVAGELGVEPPPWCSSQINLIHERPEELEEEMLWEILHDVVRESIERHRRELPENLSLGDRLKTLYNQGLLPGWIHVRRGDIILTSGLLEELRRKRKYEPMGGLRGLAERLGYQYGPRRTSSGRSVKGIIIPLSALESELTTPLERLQRLREKYGREINEGTITYEQLIQRLQEEDELPPDEARDMAVALLRKPF